MFGVANDDPLTIMDDDVPRDPPLARIIAVHPTPFTSSISEMLASDEVEGNTDDVEGPCDMEGMHDDVSVVVEVDLGEEK